MERGAAGLGLSLEQLTPDSGWHCSHFFYQLDAWSLARWSEEQKDAAVAEALEILSSDGDGGRGPVRVQLGYVSGHKADLSLMMMDPDPILIESTHRSLLSSRLGELLTTAWSYVSFTELSEYVQSVEQYRQRLIRSGEDPESSAFQKKVVAYEQRLEEMNRQRLTPDFPDWPVSCFYPMNKSRHPSANWFQLPFSKRSQLMAEHARSGIHFAGRVTQLITVGIGLDDWEWGVTLWATNPQYLKQIVYDMRFDEASARYGEFGPFYTSYLGSLRDILAMTVSSPRS